MLSSHSKLGHYRRLEKQKATCEAIEAVYEGLDRSYALSSNLTQRLLLVPLVGIVLLIDGYHRLWKAARLGIASLPAFFLSQEEADTIRCLELPPGHPLNWIEPADRRVAPV